MKTLVPQLHELVLALLLQFHLNEDGKITLIVSIRGEIQVLTRQARLAKTENRTTIVRPLAENSVQVGTCK